MLMDCHQYYKLCRETFDQDAEGLKKFWGVARMSDQEEMRIDHTHDFITGIYIYAPNSDSTIKSLKLHFNDKIVKLKPNIITDIRDISKLSDDHELPEKNCLPEPLPVFAIFYQEIKITVDSDDPYRIITTGDIVSRVKTDEKIYWQGNHIAEGIVYFR